MDPSLSSVKLSWHGSSHHQSHLNTMISSMRSTSTLVDMTLICQTGEMVKCHKIVLACASNLFRRLLDESLEKDPVIILPDMSYSSLRDLLEYIYSGYTCLTEGQLATFLSSAEGLEIGGLLHTECGGETEEMEPQDLSVNKRRRVEEDSEKDSCLASYVEEFNNVTDKGRGCSNFPKTGNNLKVYGESSEISSCNFQENLKNLFTESKVTLNKTSMPKLKEVTTNSKLPTWSQAQLQEAIEAVITQKLRFTQASSRYGIPKGTLYDNILGKSKRMLVLEQVGLTESQELSVLEFCCEISSMPYNRRTTCSLKNVRQFVTKLKREEGENVFHLTKREAFKWWWAFTKKHNIISLHYEDQDSPPSKVTRTSTRQFSHENLFHLLNCPSSLPINIPTSPLPLFPFTALNNLSTFSNSPQIEQQL